MLMGLWHLGMTAPCVGHLCSISAGDGRSFAIGVSHNCNRALAWEFGDPSIFLYAVFTFFTMTLMNPFDWWKCSEDVWCLKSNSLAKRLNYSPLKGGPLSVITRDGMPLVENRSLRYLSIFLWWVDVTRKMNKNLGKWSATIKNFCPESSWKKSIPTFIQGPAGTSCGCRVSTGIFALSMHVTHHLM